MSQTLQGEVVVADPINCASSFISNYSPETAHSGIGFFNNAAEMAGKIILCQRGSPPNGIAFADQGLFVSYAVPDAKAVLVMNNPNAGSDPQGIRGMMDGFNVCSGHGDEWGNKIRADEVYAAGCKIPFIAIPYHEGGAGGTNLAGKTVRITPANEAMFSEVIVDIQDERFGGFSGVYVPLPKRCGKVQYGASSLESAYGQRTPPNHNFCFDRGCPGAPGRACEIATCDLAATRMKYVLKSDLESGAYNMHFIAYVLKLGGVASPSYTTTTGAKGAGWAIGKWNTEALRSVGCDVLDLGESAANGWAYAFQPDASGFATRYPTTAPWELIKEYGAGSQGIYLTDGYVAGSGSGYVSVTLTPPALELPTAQRRRNLELESLAINHTAAERRRLGLTAASMKLTHVDDAPGNW